MPGVSDTINYDSFFTSTTKNYRTDLTKNFLLYRPSVNLLFDNYGHMEKGGYAIQQPLEFGDNAPTKMFTPYGKADVVPTEFANPAIIPFRRAISAAVVSEEEIDANSGKSALFDLMMGRIRLSERSVAKLLGNQIYSDGTSFGGNTFQGLAAGVSITPDSDPASGPVHGVPVGPNPWWKNQATINCGSFAAHGVRGTTDDLVFNMFLNCTDGSYDRPTAILSDQIPFEGYNAALLQIARQIDPYKVGDLSFAALEYQGMPWFWDRQCPTGRAYILNTRHCYFETDPSVMFKWSEKRTWPDQLLDIRILSLRTTLVFRSRMFLGVLDGWTL